MRKRGLVLGGVTALALTLAMPMKQACADITNNATPEAGANAATPAPAAGATVTAAPAMGVLDHLALAYWGVYYGPSLSKMDQNTPTPTGDSGGAQYIDGYFTLGARPTKSTLVGVGLPLTFTPVMGQGAKIPDMFVKVQDSKLISSGGFNMNGFVRFYAPTTGTSQSNNMIVSPRLEQVSTYDFANSRVEIGAYTFIRPYFYAGNAGSPDATQLALDVSPFLNFTLTPTVQATLWTDIIQMTSPRSGSALALINQETDVEPGVNWDITPKLSINPYINIYPGNMSLSATSIGMVIAAKAL